MWRSFFQDKKWFYWSYGGGLFILLLLVAQTYLDVLFNSWYKDFYDILQTAEKREISEFWESIKKFLDPCFLGHNMGLISDAGCPGIADPGASIVSIAHELKIKVIPIVGPSSILLALMASGFNGQSFKFNGYLPINKSDRNKEIKFLEKKSQNTTQIFMETPYRNDNLISDLIKLLKPSTKLCVATDITLESEFIKTNTIQNWKKNKVRYNKRPSVFLIQSF